MSKELLTLQDKIGRLIAAHNALQQENEKLNTSIQKKEKEKEVLNNTIENLTKEIEEKNLLLSTKALDEAQKAAMKQYLDAVLQKIENNLKLL